MKTPPPRSQLAYGFPSATQTESSPPKAGARVRAPASRFGQGAGSRGSPRLTLLATDPAAGSNLAIRCRAAPRRLPIAAVPGGPRLREATLDVVGLVDRERDGTSGAE